MLVFFTSSQLRRVLSVAVFTVSVTAVGAQTASTRPNVVFVITDDQGYGDLSVTGNPILRTPHLDQLHHESVRLTDYHVSPTCSPTRGALMSGHHSNRAGTWNTIAGRSLLREGETTLGQVFSDSGYTTGMFGKWHLGDNYPFRPEDRGFDEVVRHGGGGVGQTPDYWNNSYFDDVYFHNGKPKAFPGYCTDVFFDEAKRFIAESQDQEKPFFVYLSTNAPHSPFHSPDEFRQPYLDQGITDKETSFFGMISSIDSQVGKLRLYLANRGLAENTLFVFTTDNGSAAGKDIFNAGMRGSKTSAYDGGHRVPFFLHWPDGGFDHGQDVSQLSAHIDVLPTLIDLCDLTKPADYKFDGRSLAPLLSDPNARWSDRTIVTDSQRITFPLKWRNSSTMTANWRLVNGEELYAIKKDPDQSDDIASNHPKIVQRLRSDYEDWWDDVSANFATLPRIRLGNNAENPARLTGHDWINENRGIPWHQSLVREGYPATGYWAVHVESPGWYDIELRRWPREIDHPIQASLPPGESSNGAKAFRETPGKSLAFSSAELVMGEVRKSKPIKPGDRAITFRVKLKSGDQKLHTLFRSNNPNQRDTGAYYVSVKKR